MSLPDASSRIRSRCSSRRSSACSRSTARQARRTRMKFGVMGTGMVGAAVGGKLAALGHDVMFGSRQPEGEKARDLAAATGAKVGSHADAARHGEWIVNALPGDQVIPLLTGCDIGGKIFIDISNYDHSVDQPIIVPLGQAIQATFPSIRLVKTLNSVSAHLMVDPQSL